MSRELDPGAAGARLRLVVFVLDGQRYGLDLATTERVLAMVAVSPLPNTPAVVLGAINLHGEVVPVFDLRRRLGLPAASYGPAARLVVARTTRRTVAVAVDDVAGVTEVAADAVVPSHAVAPGTGHVSGIAPLPDGLLLVHDLDTFLSVDEERQLSGSLARSGHDARE